MRAHQYNTDMSSMVRQNISNSTNDYNFTSTNLHLSSASQEDGDNVSVLLTSDKHNEIIDDGDMAATTAANDQHEDQHLIFPTWAFILIPSLFTWVPLCIMLTSYCMIWMKIKRSNREIEGMIAFNKHQKEV